MNHRDPVVQTLLSLFVPFYILYWFYVTAKEVEQTYHQKAPGLWLLVAPTVLMLLSIPFLIASAATQSEAGTATSAIGFMLLIFVGFPLIIALSLVYMFKFSGNIEKVVGPTASRLLLFILFWFVSPAGVYIVQEKLNHLAQQSARPVAYPQPPQPADQQQPPQTPPTV